MPVLYTKKAKQEILGRLAEYRVDSGLSWYALAVQIKNSVGGFVYGNSLHRCCVRGRAADTTVRKIESFLKRVTVHA